MKTLHKLAVPVIGVMAAVALAGCSLLTPQQPTTPDTPEQTEAPATVTVDDLDDTSWAGTDSSSTDTTFTFHAGGSTAVSFNGNAYDDPADTWALEGSTLTITIYNVQGADSTLLGDAVYTGEVTDPEGPIDLELSFTNVTETRTLTITKG
jgi:hypothetical protein